MTPQYLEWQARHQRSDAACRAFIRQKLGIKTTNQSEFATRVVDEWMLGYLSALLGWGTPATDALTEAKKALDLEETRS